MSGLVAIEILYAPLNTCSTAIDFKSGRTIYAGTQQELTARADIKSQCIHA